MRSRTNKLFATLGIMLMLQISAGGASKTVCASGCDYNDISDAMGGVGNRDTITVMNGPAKYVESSGMTHKLGVLLQSTSSARDTILFKQREVIAFAAAGDSCRYKNLVIGFVDSTPVSSTSYLFSGNASTYGGHRFTHCKFFAPIFGTRMQGLVLNRSNTTTYVEPSIIDQCEFDSLDLAFAGQCNDVTIKNTLVNKWGRIWLGARAAVDSCVFVGGGGELSIVDSGNGINIKNSYFNGRNLGSTSEHISHDDKNIAVDSVKITNCTMDSMAHVAICWDYINNGLISYTKILSRPNSAVAGMLFNHGTESGTSDTVGRNTNFKNITVGANSYLFKNALASGSDSIRGMRLSKWVITSGDSILTYKTTKDTVDSVVAFKKFYVAGSPALPVLTDTMYNRGSAWMLDTVLYPYHRHSSPYPWAGSNKYLSNCKSLAYDVQATGFSVACSLASDFKHDNNFYSDSFWIHNTWWCKDSAKTYLYVDSDTSTWNAPVDSTALVPGGTTDVLTATGLSASTKYYYRMVTNTTALTGSLKDTTLTKDTTTAGGAADPTIDSVADATQRIKRLQIVKLYVTDLPDSSATTHVHLNALDFAKPGRWSGGQVWDTIPGDAPRGRYMPRLFDGADTLAVSPDSVRVFVPAFVKDGSN